MFIYMTCMAMLLCKYQKRPSNISMAAQQQDKERKRKMAPLIPYEFQHSIPKLDLCVNPKQALNAGQVS